MSVAGDAPLGGLTADLEPAAHGCLAADDARTRKLTLEVPLRVGDATGRLRVDATRRVVSVDEKTALALLDRPQALPPSDDGQQRFASLATGAGVGGAIGALGLGVPVYAAGVLIFQGMTGNRDVSTYLAPLPIAGIAMLLGGAPGCVAGGIAGIVAEREGRRRRDVPPSEARAGGYAAAASSKPPATTASAPEERTNHSRRASADPGPTKRIVVPPS